MHSAGGDLKRESLVGKLLLSVALVFMPLFARAATPPEGVPLKVRRGFFVETGVGAFWTLGGESGYSNAEPYLQLGLGYDVTEHLSLGAHFGLGTNAVNCFAGYVPGTQDCRLADSFTIAFGDMTAAYRFRVGERFYLAPKVAGGYTRLDPAPVEVSGGSASAAVYAPNAGLGFGFEYATSMEHFTIGADLLVRYVVGPNIPTFAVFPRVKYTF